MAENTTSRLEAGKEGKLTHFSGKHGWPVADVFKMLDNRSETVSIFQSPPAYTRRPLPVLSRPAGGKQRDNLRVAVAPHLYTPLVNGSTGFRTRFDAALKCKKQCLLNKGT
jgi:hypothetical protein